MGCDRCTAWPITTELLEFAALLHDAGFYIAASKHHKHGQYLIENVGLSGFSSEEIKILSHCVLYHRKSTPKDTHESFVALGEPLRRKVRLFCRRFCALPTGSIEPIAR